MTHTKPRSLLTRLLSGISALATAALALPALPAITASAGGDAYDLYVRGVQVTDDNANNILGDGTASYNYESKYLHLSGDLTDSSTVIWSGIDGLTISVDKDITITETTSYLYCIAGERMTITGEGKLTLRNKVSNISTAVSVKGLTLEDIDLTVEASVGIQGSEGSGSLDIKHSNVDISANAGAVVNFNDGVTLTDSVIFEPEQYSISNGSIMTNGSTAGSVTIYAGYDVDDAYDLYICGTQVTGRNRFDILRNGVFTFDNETATLYIKNSATITTAKPLIKNNIDDLTIAVENDATLEQDTEDASSVIYTSSSATITGPGKLTLIGSNADSGIRAESGVLTIKGADIDIQVPAKSLNGSMGSSLNIIGSDIHCAGTISYFRDGIELEYAEITAPTNAKIDLSLQHTYNVYTADGELATDVTISSTAQSYPLYIAGTWVNDLNKSDVLGNGVFFYDSESKMLFVYENYSCDETVIFNSGIEDLVIYTLNNCTLQSNKHDSILIEKDTVITGPGGLTAWGNYAAIRITCDSELTVLNTDLAVSGQDGIVGDEYHDVYDSLKVIHSNLELWGGNGGACYDLTGGFDLIGCTETTQSVQKPVGFYSGNNYPIDEVIIEADVNYTVYPLSVCGVEVNEFNAADILGNGAASFDLENNTLHLKRSITSAMGYYVLNLWREGMTVSADNDVTLKTTEYQADCINAEKSVTFTGPGKLSLITNYDGIWCTGSGNSVLFDNADVSIRGRGGLIASSSSNIPLTVRNSDIDIDVDDECVALSGFSSITLTGSELAGPEGVFFKNGTAVAETPEGENSAESVIISRIKPNITAQPHNQTNVLGYTAKFSLTAEGEDLTYQWQMNSGSGWKNSGGDGATTNTLSIPITTGRNGNKYRCIVTNAYGGQTISDEVMLKVKTKITTQPASVTAPIGDVAKFTVAASGVGLTYQWQYNKGDGWKNSNGTGSKTNTLSINVAAGYNGYQYRCIINNTNNQPQTSSAATLKVKTKITAQPASLTKPVGEAAKFTVTATGVGLTYQWQYNKGDGWATSNGTGSKTATLTINTAAGYNGYKYRCVITDANGTKTYSSAATLKVKTTITGQPKAVSAAVGTAAKFTVTATGAGLKYQWQYNKGDGWKTSNATGSKTATLSINTAAGYNGYQYRCIVTDASGATVTSSAAKLTVKTAITTQPNGVNTTVGSTAKFTVAATGAGLKYQWQYNSGDGWKNSGATGATTATLSINAKATYNGWKYRCVITDANGTTTTSSVATLKIKAAITAQPANVSAAVGDTAKFTVTATGVGLTYQWQYNSGDGWKNSGATGATTAALSINAKVGYNGYQYRCIITDGNGKTTTSEAATLTIKPAITGQPASVTATTGSTAKFTVAATGVNLSYQWQYNSGSGWKNSGATGATTATLSISAKSTYNGWQYRCIVTDASGATATSSAAKLTVK